MKNRLLEIGIFILTLLIMGLFGAFYSFVFAETAGNTALIVAPAANFKLVEKFVCPAGASLETQLSGETVTCRAADGSLSADLRPRAASRVIELYFLLCFVPTYFPGAILLWVLLNKAFPHYFDNSPAPLDEDDA
jgi:hypothetical protein